MPQSARSADVRAQSPVVDPPERSALNLARTHLRAFAEVQQVLDGMFRGRSGGGPKAVIHIEDEYRNRTK
jgi:hypothetical protein